MASGLFINFEGLDGSGKTTQLRLLATRLREQGSEVLETAEPGGTPIGMKIRKVLLDPENTEMSPTAELLLYFAARAQNVDQWIRPALNRGVVVLTDRYTDSTRAYQGAARNLGEETVLALEQIACRGCVPDLTLLIDIDLEISRQRAKKRNDSAGDRIEAEALDFHRRVRDEYYRIAKQEPHRFRIVDGRGDIGEVAERVYATVQPLIAARG